MIIFTAFFWTEAGASTSSTKDMNYRVSFSYAHTYYSVSYTRAFSKETGIARAYRNSVSKPYCPL